MNPSKLSILIFSSAFVLSSCSNPAKPTEQKKCSPKAQKQTFPVKIFQETYVHDRWGNPIHAKPKYLIDGTNSGVYFSGCKNKEQKIKKGKQNNTNGSKGLTSEKILSGEDRERREKISKNIEEDISKGILIGGQEGLIYILNKRMDAKLENPNFLNVFDLKLKNKGINYLENIYIANKDILLVDVNTEYKSGMTIPIFDYDVTGTSTKTIYISAIQKGGLLYKINGEKYRGLISFTDITKIPEVIKVNEEKGKDIVGSLKAELKNNSIQNILIPISKYNESISPVKYTLVKPIKSKKIFDNDLTDTISDIVDAAEEHPIAATAITAAGIYWYKTSDSAPAYSPTSDKKCKIPSLAEALGACTIAVGGCGLIKDKLVQTEVQDFIGNLACSSAVKLFSKGSLPTIKDAGKDEIKRLIGKTGKEAAFVITAIDIKDCTSNLMKKEVCKK